jgi:hypothetical protein
LRCRAPRKPITPVTWAGSRVDPPWTRMRLSTEAVCRWAAGDDHLRSPIDVCKRLRI